MITDLAQSGPVLKVLSTVAAGLFAGGALYITVVEHPARMTHDPTSAITMWKPSFVRAKSIQSKLVIVSTLSSIGVYTCLRQQESNDALNWLGAGCSMLTMFPITWIFIRPLNNQLLETEKCISLKGEEWITENLHHWGKLHSVRTVFSLGTFCFMVYRLFKS